MPHPVLHRIPPLLESREVHRGQLNQRGRTVNVAYGTGSKCIAIQAKRDLEGGIRVLDLTEDEFCHRQV